MQDVLQLLAQASQLIGQAHAAVQQYGANQSQQNPQVQQGLPQQQAFANPGGMHGAAQGQNFNPGAAQQYSGAGQNVAQQGLPGQQAAIGQQFGGGFGAAPQQQGQVTPDMVQQLITPLVQNEQIKAALTQQMQAMGIQNLPDARPEQLPELYQRFQQVEQAARAQGLIGGGAAQGGAPSII